MPFPSVDAHRSESLRRLLSIRGVSASASRHGGMGHAEKTSIDTGSVADLTGTFRFGIEEEYFLVDAETKAIALTVPEALFAAAKSSTLGRGKGEFLQQQLEVATEPHVDMEKARAELRQLCHMVTAIAAPHGLAILTADTHPTLPPSPLMKPRMPLSRLTNGSRAPRLSARHQHRWLRSLNDVPSSLSMTARSCRVRWNSARLQRVRAIVVCCLRRSRSRLARASSTSFTSTSSGSSATSMRLRKLLKDNATTGAGNSVAVPT